MIGKMRLGYMAAQNYGKKHFATAVKSMKELKAKVKILSTSSIKAFGSKHKVALVAGGGAAGIVAGYQSGKKKGVKMMKTGYEKTVLASSAKELGYKNIRQVHKLPMKDKQKIAHRAAKKYMKQGKDYITFYSQKGYMPQVGKKKFAYTKAGKKKAKAYAKKKGKKVKY